MRELEAGERPNIGKTDCKKNVRNRGRVLPVFLIVYLCRHYNQIKNSAGNGNKGKKMLIENKKSIYGHFRVFRMGRG